MKFLLILTLLLSLPSFSQEQECNENTVFFLQESGSSLLNLPPSCFDKTVTIAFPENNKDKLNYHVAQSVGQTLITLNNLGPMKGQILINDCYYGGDIDIGSDVNVYGIVTVNNKNQHLEIQHTQLYSLYKVNFKRLEISPVAGQHFLYVNPQAIDVSQLSIQPTNVGVSLKLNKRDHKKRPIKINFNVGPGIDINQYNGTSEYKITPKANFRLAIPL